MSRTGSTKVHSSKMAHISKPFKHASARFDQKLNKLKSKLTKPKAGDQEKVEITVVSEVVCGQLGDNAHKQSTDLGTVNQDGDNKQSIDLNTPKQNAKAAKRDARKARWAARRCAFKRFAKKAGKGIAITGAVVLGVIFGPILLVLDLTIRLIAIVVGLVIDVLVIICAPFCACCFW